MTTAPPTSSHDPHMTTAPPTSSHDPHMTTATPTFQFAQHGGVQAIKDTILNTENITLQVQ